MTGRNHISRILVLVNPISGSGRGKEAAEPIRHAFVERGIEAEIVLLTGPGSAGEIIRENIGGAHALAAVGGDGTVNEVAGAAYKLGLDIPIGLIPLGLSNCLAKHLGLPNDIEKAASVIAGGSIRKIDLCLVNGRIVHSFLGAGFDAAVVRKTAEKRKGAIKDLDYVKAAFSAFGDENWPVLSVEADGQILGKGFFQAILISVDNYAHYFSLKNPDGFRLYLFKGKSKGALFRTLFRLFPNRDLDKACDLAIPVEKSLKILTVKGSACYQFDGEAGGDLPIECEIKREALSFFAGRGFQAG